jgi:predicted membrane-bound spermidine synthase
MRAVLYALFVLSGAAGLIYEMVWSRYLALFLGHSAYAQVLVIGIFLGGMALGALLAGWRSARWRDPLLWYAGAEVGVGLIGFLFHDVYLAATGFAYDVAFPTLAGTVLLTPFKWALAAVLILPQSVLLGATFPLMAAGVLRRTGEAPGGVLAWLYFSNSFGAALGVLVAGFVLLAWAGLPGTMLVAALINLLVALGALSVARRVRAAAELQLVTVEAATADPQAPSLPAEQLVRLLLAVSFGTAVASFAYEIGWLRMLALVLGSATHAFELMLSAFILGLAVGSLWVRRRADRWRRPLRALGIVQLAMGACALATLTLYGDAFHWTAGLLATFARSDAGYVGFNLARYGICLAIMFPASFCAGMTLPLITRTLLAAGVGERSIGAVYGVNTLGAIVGVALAGLVLLPWVGLKGVIVGGASLDLALGVAVLFGGGRRSLPARRLAYGGLAVAVALAGVAVLSPGFDRRLLISGVYRHGRIPEPSDITSLFYQDGRTATVDVAQNHRRGHVSIHTNGKPDASLPDYWFAACDDTTRYPLGSDAATQALTSLITLAHAPAAQTAVVVGHGSGMSAHVLLGSPQLEEVVTVEIEREMVRGSREFSPPNRRVFNDPRSTIVIEDAKTYFAAANRRFDIILSEPSNPWVSGVASLFTSEFYRHVKRYLADGGVFGQWLQLYEIDDALVMTVLAAIHENFPSYEVFLTQGSDMLLVAGDAPALPSPDWSVARLPAVAEDLCHNLPLTPEALEASRLTHRGALAPLLDGIWRSNSDFFPVLDLGAERTRYLRSRADGLQALPLQPFDVTAPLFARRSLPGTAHPAPISNLPRAEALALGAALRENEVPGRIAGTEWEGRVQRARYRLAQWQALLAGGEPPADWMTWLANFNVVDRDRNTGTAGYVDEELYGAAFAFMDRHEAPPLVRQVLTFRRALAGWDFPQAAQAAWALLEGGAHRAGLIGSDDLLDGGVTAMLLSGDLERARLFYRVLVTARQRSPDDVRSRLVAAYLRWYSEERGEEAGTPPMSEKRDGETR